MAEAKKAEVIKLAKNHWLRKAIDSIPDDASIMLAFASPNGKSGRKFEMGVATLGQIAMLNTQLDQLKNDALCMMDGMEEDA